MKFLWMKYFLMDIFRKWLRPRQYFQKNFVLVTYNSNNSFHCFYIFVERKLNGFCISQQFYCQIYWMEDFLLLAAYVKKANSIYFKYWGSYTIFTCQQKRQCNLEITRRFNQKPFQFFVYFVIIEIRWHDNTRLM